MVKKEVKWREPRSASEVWAGEWQRSRWKERGEGGVKEECFLLSPCSPRDLPMAVGEVCVMLHQDCLSDGQRASENPSMHLWFRWEYDKVSRVWTSPLSFLVPSYHDLSLSQKATCTPLALSSLLQGINSPKYSMYKQIQHWISLRRDWNCAVLSWLKHIYYISALTLSASVSPHHLHMPSDVVRRDIY